MRAMAFVIGMLCVLLRCVVAQSSNPIGSIVGVAQSGSTPGDDSVAHSTKQDSSLSTPSASSRRSRAPVAAATVSRTRHPHSGTPSLFTPSIIHRPTQTTVTDTFPQHTRHPSVPPPPPGTEHHPHPHNQKGSERRKIVEIVFGVLGGILSVFLLYTVARCAYSWRRTPERDRIQAMLDRHYLAEEMEQRERQDLESRLLSTLAGRRPSITSPPPPPYQPAPAYDDVVTPSPNPGHESRPSV